ncbi:ankyrin repeat domain-containing protein (plasmid) [Bacillus sp. 31A1R]|uniref:Ankyrin repeat domain-containing protein n=1 Tax=Robertmurraya mangrovi TaxID=3098077 RepID=A0ABU5IUH2_9BACI|nr:ankyrin repeat domain-containing protein [Bacillus sp. 31A1R]MDZ5470796.1 ankyrin repeat domain-containing protein [Bacillus sp. 31A1R]
MRRLIMFITILILLTGCYNKSSIDSQEDIYKYIQEGDTSKVIELVTKKNINEQIKDKEPIILYAGSIGNEELTISLLEKAPDLNMKNHIGNNLLHIAAENNMKKLVEKIIINKLIDINDLNNFSMTPLYLALTKNNNDLAKLLLRNNADPNVANMEGFTPLHEAASKNNEEIVKILIKKGASVDTATSTMLTPLMIAAQNGQTEIVKLLINKGADINVVDVDGYSALAYAILSNQTESTKLLLSYNSKQDIKVSGDHSLIDLAKMNNNNELVKIIEGSGKSEKD